MAKYNLLLLLLLSTLQLANVAFAQFGYTINNIDIPKNDAGVATITAGNSFLSFVNATVASNFVDDQHTGSYELLAGEKGSPDSGVVDIICVNQDIFVFACQYTFSASQPAGSYHFRVNITGDNGNSVLSDTFQVTATTFDCLTPPAPKFNMTSTSDPNYRSLAISGPSAGFVVRLDTMVWVNWGYRDVRNAGNTGISNLEFTLVSESNGQTTGLIVADSDALFTSQIAFTFNGTSVSVGAWRVRADYSNTFENGNQTVSSLSDVFYIEGSDYTKSCDGLGKSTIHSGGMSWRGRDILSSKVQIVLALGIIFFWFC